MSLPEPSHDATILVTGGSAGIGAAFAHGLAARGHHVTVVARRAQRLEALGEELRREFGAGAAVHACDLGDGAARRALVEALARGDRAVAAVVNSAGIGSFGRLHELPADFERRQVALNVEALHDLTAAFLPRMVERGAGAVLNVGSTAGFVPLPGNATYAATKAFVVSLSEALHAELAGTGVSCTVVCPGAVATDFHATAPGGRPATGTPGFLWASPAEVARAGIEGMVQGRRVVVPRAADKLQVAVGRLAPRGVLLAAIRRVAPQARPSAA